MGRQSQAGWLSRTGRGTLVGLLSLAISALSRSNDPHDKAIEERDACAARAELYKQGSLLFADEVQDYLLNRFYVMDTEEAVAYITAANSLPCPSP